MNTTTLHIPIDKDVREKLDAKAKRLGFDSVQAYIRVWAKAEAENRVLNFGDDAWGEPSDAAAKRLNGASEDAKKGKNVTGPYHNVDDFMKDLRA